MENTYLMVTVRDINLLCQHFKTYALIEGENRRQKINHARKRKGIWKSEQRLATNGCFTSENLVPAF